MQMSREECYAEFPGLRAEVARREAKLAEWRRERERSRSEEREQRRQEHLNDPEWFGEP